VERGAKAHHVEMLRALSLSLVVFSFACHDAASSSTTQPCEGAGTKADGASAGMTQPIADAAKGATVERMKVRFDDAGAIVKQSVYHADRSGIPQAVLDLAEQTYPGGQTKHYETEHYADFGPVFEVEVETADAKLCEVAARPDGELVYTECRIDAGELPEPVSARVSATFPEGKILEAERKSGPEADEFTVEVEVGGREFYLRIAPDGTLIGKLVRVPAIVELPID
jgi:hypothetical protein